MKLVYSNENQFLVNNMKNLIEAQGINTFVKNEFAQGAVGEISAFDAWPEVWVVDDDNFDRATEIVESSQNTKSAADWACQECYEVNDPAFDFCWKCQHEKSF
ncbi:MAG: DUF2007 domain-containing protein [Psychromonas sp.]